MSELGAFLTAGLLVRRPYAVLLRLDGETTDRIHEPLTLDEAAEFLRSIASDETVARAEIVPRTSQTIVRLGHMYGSGDGDGSGYGYGDGYGW